MILDMFQESNGSSIESTKTIVKREDNLPVLSAILLSLNRLSSAFSPQNFRNSRACLR